MKKIAILALLSSSFAASAHALIVGADVGYLTDAKEEYISARLAHEFKADASLAHLVELELGFTRQEDSGLTGDFVPVTINYRAESSAAQKLGCYFGAGVGFARTKVSGFAVSDSDTSMAAQAFAGLSYQAAPTVTLHAGVKYIWIGDVELFSVKTDVGDDLALTAGLSIKF